MSDLASISHDTTLRNTTSHDTTLTADLTTETRLESLLRRGKAAPRFLQGVFPFAGRGIYDIGTLDDSLIYVVPDGKAAQVHYFRAGNLSDDLIYLVLTADGRPIRYFPVGPKGDFHVPLAIVESHPAGTRIAVAYAAPRGLTGAIVLDMGLIELTGDARQAAALLMEPILTEPILTEPTREVRP